jgi:hypothetical protein
MFNQQDLLDIMKICDAAIKFGGIEVAEIAMPVVFKCRQNIMQMQTQPQSPQLVHQEKQVN